MNAIGARGGLTGSRSEGCSDRAGIGKIADMSHPRPVPANHPWDLTAPETLFLRFYGRRIPRAQRVAAGIHPSWERLLTRVTTADLVARRVLRVEPGQTTGGFVMRDRPVAVPADGFAAPLPTVLARARDNYVRIERLRRTAGRIDPLRPVRGLELTRLHLCFRPHVKGFVKDRFEELGWVRRRWWSRSVPAGLRPGRNDVALTEAGLQMREHLEALLVAPAVFEHWMESDPAGLRGYLDTAGPAVLAQADLRPAVSRLRRRPLLGAGVVLATGLVLDDLLLAADGFGYLPHHADPAGVGNLVDGFDAVDYGVDSGDGSGGGDGGDGGCGGGCGGGD